MIQASPLDAAHLTTFMQSQGIAGRLVHLPEDTLTVEAAARALGTQTDRIVKSILFMALATPVLVVANGTARVDYKRLADHLGLSRKRLKLADAPTVLELTGFEVGTLPPFGHRAPLRTLIDERVLAQPDVYAGGGAVDALVHITPAEIARAARAEVVRLVQEAG